MESKPTVFIVDDDPAARSSVAALVSSHDLDVETFASAEEFLAAYDPKRRGCLIVDVRMTGMSGLVLQEQLVARGSTLPVIVITGYADVPMAVRAMQAGAATFLEKPCADKELWESISAALESRARDDQDRQLQAQIKERRATLTESELTVLDAIVAGKPSKVIATELGLGLRTIELRRAAIMKKMQAGSLPELVRLVLIAEGKPVHLPPATGTEPSKGP